MESTAGKIAVMTALTAGGCGCLASPVLLVIVAIVVIIFCGLGVILAPLIALILLFGGGGGDTPSRQDTDEVIAVFQGDGTGELAEDTVPEDLLEAIKDAGDLCTAIGPAVIASQIEEESDFQADLVGPDGAQGVSQLPPDKFQEFGEDEDDNGQVSALDPEDSILAQGRYLCSLAEQTQSFINTGQVTGNVLDLTLAAYDAGLDSVVQARGVPVTNESQGYVLRIRAQFAKYLGVVDPVPDGDATAVPEIPDEPEDPDQNAR